MIFLAEAYSPKTKVAIFGVAIGSFVIIARTKHPSAKRPIIDYDFAMLVEPTILVGSMLGVYLNVVFPSYLIIFFLVLLLSFTGYKTFKKGIEWYKKEKQSVLEVKSIELDKADQFDNSAKFERVPLEESQENEDNSIAGTHQENSPEEIKSDKKNYQESLLEIGSEESDNQISEEDIIAQSSQNVNRFFSLKN